jgi:hypothetical protein
MIPAKFARTATQLNSKLHTTTNVKVRACMKRQIANLVKKAFLQFKNKKNNEHKKTEYKYSKGSLYFEVGTKLPAYFKACVAYSPKINVRETPWTRKDPYCGDDAFFFGENHKVASLGIADGVSGWSKYNVDPSEFAWALMGNCKQELENGKKDPVEILNSAYENVISQEQVKAGSMCLKFYVNTVQVVPVVLLL